jgi:hypothetical protein
MSTVYDSRGKIFTNVVSKQAISAIIQTLTHQIQGNIHVRAGERIKDELDSAEMFLAVTDALVFDPRGAILYETDFIVINRDHIMWIVPEEELPKEAES